MDNRTSASASDQEAARSNETDNKPVRVFSEVAPQFATVCGVFIVSVVVMASWAAGPWGKRSGKHVMSAMRSLGDIAEDSGWNVIGISVALVAVVITAVTIVGLRDPDPQSLRRRNLVMSMAEVFMFAATGLLAGLITAAALGYVVLIIESGESGVFSRGTNLFVVLVASVVLWTCSRSVNRHLRGIALSDDEQARETSNVLDMQITHYQSLRKKAADALATIQGQEPLDTTSRAHHRTTVKTIVMSAFWIIVASAIAAALVWVPLNTDANSTQLIGRSLSVAGGTAVLAITQMVFAVVSYLWSFQYLRAGEAGAMRGWKFAGSIAFTTPMLVIVLVSAVSGILSPEADAPWLKRIALCALIFGPSFLSFMVPKKCSWRAVSILSALRATDDQLKVLERESARAEEPATVSRPDSAAACENSQRIVELLQQLVESNKTITSSSGASPQEKSLPTRPGCIKSAVEEINQRFRRIF